MKVDKPKSFKNANAFRTWLQKNQDTAKELILRIYKKNSGVKSITYQEALEEALCFGWIDGVRLSFDDLSFLQRFTPRAKRSKWSKRNTLIIERLLKEKKMEPRGLLEVETAKADGRWFLAYGNPKKPV